MFWNDLTYANGLKLNLIEGNFNPCGAGGVACAAGAMGDPSPGDVSIAGLSSWLPAAKLGGANFIYAYSRNGINYYGILAITSFYWASLVSNPGVTVRQAFEIDKKTDDGLPQSGNVTAVYISNITILTAGAAGTGQLPVPYHLLRQRKRKRDDAAVLHGPERRRGSELRP